MKILLDTHCFLWWLMEPERLNRQARDLLRASENDLYLSAASAWEMSIKYSLGKLKLPDPPQLFVPMTLAEQSMKSLEIHTIHALEAGGLPEFHRDPFDRILVAQSSLEKMKLLTADRIFEQYADHLSVPSIWAGP